MVQNYHAHKEIETVVQIMLISHHPFPYRCITSTTVLTHTGGYVMHAQPEHIYESWI